MSESSRKRSARKRRKGPRPASAGASGTARPGTAGAPKPRRWQRRLTANEKWGGYGAAAIAVTSFLVLWVPNLHRRSEGGPSGTFFLAEGIALAAVLIAAVASGRRAALAAALLLVAAGPWGPEALFQVLFLAAALWQAYVAVAAHRQQRPDRHRRP